MAVASSAPATATSSPMARFAHFIGIASPKSPNQQLPGAEDDDWFLPYHGPYEAPKSAATKSSGMPYTARSTRDGFPLSAPAQSATFTRSEKGAETDTGSEFESERGRSRRRSRIAPKTLRKSFVSHHLSDDGVPSSRSRVSAPSFLSLDDGGVGESPAPPPRASGVPSSAASYYGPSGQGWPSLGGFLAMHAKRPPSLQTSTPRQSMHSPRASTVVQRQPVPQQPSTFIFPTPPAPPAPTSAPVPRHAYNYYGFNNGSTGALSSKSKSLSAPSAGALLTTSSPPSREPHPYANALTTSLSAPITPKPQQRSGTLRSPPTLRVPETAPAIGAKPPGILRGLKASLSTPNMRAVYVNTKPSPSPSRNHQHQALQAETWCDALLFAKPRFRAHVISPPMSPVSPAPPPLPPPPPPQPTKLRKRSRSRSLSKPPLPPANEDLLEKALRERAELEAARAKWAVKAESSFANKRSRSLSRSALRSRVRTQSDVAVGTGTATRLAAAALSQGTMSSSSYSHSHHSHSHGHSRTASSGTGESWGRSVIRRCVEPAVSPETEKAPASIALSRALASGTTAKLKLERDNDSIVLDIPAPAVRTTPSPVGLALTTPPDPDRAPHPYAAGGAYPAQPTTPLAPDTPSAIAVRHRMPPRASIVSVPPIPPLAPLPMSSPPTSPPPGLPPSPPHSPPPGARMYAFTRTGNIREVLAREIMQSPPPPSPMAATPLSPASPSSNPLRQSLAAAPLRAARTASAYVRDVSDRHSMLGMDEVLSLAFRGSTHGQEEESVGGTEEDGEITFAERPSRDTIPDPEAASHESSPKASPRLLGSLDELEYYKDLFYRPGQHGRSPSASMGNRTMSSGELRALKAITSSSGDSGLHGLSMQLGEELDALRLEQAVADLSVAGLTMEDAPSEEMHMPWVQPRRPAPTPLPIGPQPQPVGGRQRSGTFGAGNALESSPNTSSPVRPSRTPELRFDDEDVFRLREVEALSVPLPTPGVDHQRVSAVPSLAVPNTAGGDSEARESFVTTTSGALSLIADFPTPPQHEHEQAYVIPTPPHPQAEEEEEDYDDELATQEEDDVLEDSPTVTMARLPPTGRAQHRSTFGGEGELVDAWNANRRPSKD